MLNLWYSRYVAAPEEDTEYRPTPAALYKLQLLEATEQEQARMMPSEKKALVARVLHKVLRSV